MSGPLLKKDVDWVRQAFLVRHEDLATVDQQNRTFSSVSLKFEDTTPGGNIAINPPPQFTRYCDIRSAGKNSANQKGKGRGMGRYYSEAIHDNQQIIYLRFGVPKFNSLSTFFTGFYNTGAGQLARTGRANSAFYNLGRAAGFVVSVAFLPLLVFQAIGVGLKFFLEKPTSKFYYLKPTMPLYWNAVTTMVNHIAVNRGIMPKAYGNDESAEKYRDGYQFDAAALKKLHDLMPDIFTEKGGIDVYALANKAQRLANKQELRNQAEFDKENDSRSLAEIVRTIYDNNGDAGLLKDTKPTFRGEGENPDEKSYLGRWFANMQSKPKDANDGSGGETIDKTDAANDGWWSFLKAELADGSAFASFRVNSTGPVSESFSNQVTESELSNKINGMSSSARSTNFSFANGNLVGGMAGALVGGVLNAAKDFASGIGEAFAVTGLAALNGAAFVDIPKHWQSSSASLPRASYTINLVSPYGNPISQLLNLYVPLAMLLAGALPLSTGKQSFTSPFICELYDRGRCQTRLGMIDSLSVTRGTGNLGFNNQGNAMGIDVTFSVVDMSSILHMPISEGLSLTDTIIGGAAGAVSGGILLGPAGALAGAAAGTAMAAGVFDEDTVFSDYMAVLGGMGLTDQIYPLRRLKLNITRKLADFDSMTSMSHHMAWAGNTAPGRFASLWWKTIER